MHTVAGFVLGIVLLPVLISAGLGGRIRGRSIIAVGPEPLISNVYNVLALRKIGYEAVSFVTHTYFITDQFDRNFFRRRSGWRTLDRLLSSILAQCWVLWNARTVYFFFNGGPFGRIPVLRSVEPALYRLAGVKTVVMPYGGDVQDLTRSRNLLFKHAMAIDYPASRFERKRVAERIDRWIRHADAVVAGVEWVDYLYFWSHLSVAYFSIDLDRIDVIRNGCEKREGDAKRIRVLHAPNHRAIKGTEAIVKVVGELNGEGIDVELVLIEKVSNAELLERIAECDIVADQLIIGWYAMFAIEGMAMEKPVVCHVREDLEQFYQDASVLEEGDLPLVKASPSTVKEELRKLCEMSGEHRREIGRAGRRYVEKYHSLDGVGKFFAGVNSDIGIEPVAEGK